MQIKWTKPRELTKKLEHNPPPPLPQEKSLDCLLLDVQHSMLRKFDPFYFILEILFAFWIVDTLCTESSWHTAYIQTIMLIKGHNRSLFEQWEQVYYLPYCNSG